MEAGEEELVLPGAVIKEGSHELWLHWIGALYDLLLTARRRVASQFKARFRFSPRRPAKSSEIRNISLNALRNDHCLPQAFRQQEIKIILSTLLLEYRH